MRQDCRDMFVFSDDAERHEPRRAERLKNASPARQLSSSNCNSRLAIRQTISVEVSLDMRNRAKPIDPCLRSPK
jgi:hypothetical protein